MQAIRALLALKGWNKETVDIQSALLRPFSIDELNQALTEQFRADLMKQNHLTRLMGKREELSLAFEPPWVNASEIRFQLIAKQDVGNSRLLFSQTDCWLCHFLNRNGVWAYQVAGITDPSFSLLFKKAYDPVGPAPLIVDLKPYALAPSSYMPSSLHREIKDAEGNEVPDHLKDFISYIISP